MSHIVSICMAGCLSLCVYMCVCEWERECVTGYFVLSLFKTKQFSVSIITEKHAFINKAHLHTLGKILFPIHIIICTKNYQHWNTAHHNQLTACRRSFMRVFVLWLCTYCVLMRVCLCCGCARTCVKQQWMYVCVYACTCIRGCVRVCGHAARSCVCVDRIGYAPCVRFLVLKMFLKWRRREQMERKNWKKLQ